MTSVKFTTKIECIPASDDSRHALSSVVVTPNGDGAYAWGTDGHVAAVARVAASSLEREVLIPAKAFRPAGKKDRTMRLDGGLWRQAGKDSAVEDATGQGKPPALEDVMPEYVQDQYHVACFSASLLAKLAAALNGTGADNPGRLVVAFPKNNRKPILAMAGDGNGIGVLMPCFAGSDYQSTDGGQEQFEQYEPVRKAFVQARKDIQ